MADTGHAGNKAPVVESFTDKFTPLTTFVGPAIDKNPFGGTARMWRLRSFVDKRNGTYKHQLWIDISYDGNWRWYEFAADDRATALTVSKLGSQVLGMCGSGSCVLDETIAVDIDDAVLRALGGEPYSVKITARSGDFIILDVSPQQVALQLDAVDAARKLIQDSSPTH